MRQFDAQPYGCAARQRGTTIAGFHDARPAAGDHRDPASGDQLAHLFGITVERGILCHSGGTENTYGRPQVGERVESVHEFGLDAQHSPRIHMKPVG